MRRLHPLPHSSCSETAFALQNFPHPKSSTIEDSNNPLAVELESENDGGRTKIFLSVLLQFHFG
jgi:hypothetical protein